MQETKLKLLERIVDRRQDSLYRFAYFRTGSQADAEDIVQDVLLRLFHEEYERIAGLLALLPEEQAEVIRLKTSDSLTFARIAEITGSTEATVKSRFRYGIGKLRKLINH